MFPGQQGATCPAQIWPPRLGIKLLEGGPSTEKCAEGRYFRMAPHKIGAISLVIAQSVERAKVVISTLPPLYFMPPSPHFRYQGQETNHELGCRLAQQMCEIEGAQAAGRTAIGAQPRLAGARRFGARPGLAGACLVLT